MINSQAIIICNFKISVKNNKTYPVDIVILDQLPISATNEISVQDEEYKDGTLAQDTKIVTWKLDLPSKAEKKLNIKYKVKSPKNSFLVID